VLNDRSILLGITGSIAAYKSVELARRLQDEGAEVSIVMTDSASRFITPLSLESITGKPAHTDLYTGYISHISLVQDTHLFIVAPATANTISKFASGIADNLLTTLWLAYRGPVLMAPAMNSAMFAHPAVRKNMTTLSAMGTRFIGPAQGKLACGEEGEGRMSEVSDILEAARSVLSPQDLSGHSIVITAGPTREPIDPVRFISNRSSGKMGFALARAALRRGARVTLISGPTALRPPAGAEYIPVERSVEMDRAVTKAFRKATAVIMAAAVSDFTPEKPGRSKIPKDRGMTLQLRKTPDILQKIGKSAGSRFLVGFAAETGENIGNALGKLKRKNLDLVVFNNISRKGAGFDTDTNIITLIDKKGKATEYSLMKKEEAADRILDEIVQSGRSGRRRK
jgi:phosphopantothenoylcysteine decarboxylase/phosphopantothenate--cysteine ligase